MGHNPPSARQLNPRAQADTAPPLEEEHAPDFNLHSIRRPRAVWVLLILFTGLAVLALLFVLGYMPLKQREAGLEAESKRVQSAAPRVLVIHATRSAASSEILLPGQIEAVRETTIYARTSGYLKRWLVDIGDGVKAGQLLAEIDSPEVDMQLEQARATLEQVNASLQQAEATLEQTRAQLSNAEANEAMADLTMKRYEPLRGTNAVTAQDFSQKETDVKTTHAAVVAGRAAIVSDQAKVAAAHANVTAAQADMRRLEVLKSFELVTAPFDGTITLRQTEAGALITAGSGTAGQPLFHIARTDPVRVFIDVPQAYAGSIKTGQEAKLLVREFPGNAYVGKVARTAGAIDIASRTLHTEIHVPNPGGELLTGTYAQVKINIVHDQPELILPGSALVVNAEGTQLALVKDGHVHYQKITVDNDFGASFSVTSGLSENDDVIATPGERLKEGLAVTVTVPVAAQ